MTGDASARLRTALELFEVGEQLVRSRLRRTHPDWEEHEVEAAVQRWLRDRPDAPYGDHPGGPSARVIRG